MRPARPVRRRDPCRPGSTPAAAGGCGRRRRAAPSPARRHTSSFRARWPPRRRARAPCQARPHGRWRERRDRSRPWCRVSGVAKPTPRARANSARAGLMSTSVTSAPGSRPHRYATRAPTTPAPTTAMRSAGPGAASQTALSAVSILAASTARCGGRFSGSTTAALAGILNRFWCGWSVKTVRPRRASVAAFDPADRGIAIFHRKRKMAGHEGRAHALEFALGTRPASTSASVPRLIAP